MTTETQQELVVEEISIAQRIWDEDTTVYEPFDHIVEWIGNGKPTSNKLLKEYMSFFDFKQLPLEQAFRNLCLKLHLKGETQQIDRILFEFSDRYFECNPNCIFGSTDTVHAIVYSLLLLNTDLHVAQGDYKKMSRSEFVKNTMNTIQTPAFLEEDDHHRASGQSLDWNIPLQRTPSNQSAISSKSWHSTLPTEMPLDLKTWQAEVRALLKHMYNNIRSSQIHHHSSPSPLNRVGSALKRGMGTIIFKTRDLDEPSSPMSASIASLASTTCSLQNYQTVSAQLQTDIPNAYASNAPYYKEGMVTRKHLLERTNQKAKHRDWKDCFMVIEQSQLRMYKLLDQNSQKRRMSLRTLEEPDPLGGGDWMSNASLMGTIDLKHALANGLPSGYSRQRQHAFALQQPNGGVYLFQVGSEEQVQAWVSTCNYWAARESKEPLVGGIGSMEYGWGPCLDGSEDELVIHEWQAPSPPMMASLLDEEAQLEVLKKQVKDLSIELDSHRDIKSKMESRLSQASKSINSRAMINWENKSQYLLHEIIKYQNYCDCIERSLELQKKVTST